MRIDRSLIKVLGGRWKMAYLFKLIAMCIKAKVPCGQFCTFDKNENVESSK